MKTAKKNQVEDDEFETISGPREDEEEEEEDDEDEPDDDEDEDDEDEDEDEDEEESAISVDLRVTGDIRRIKNRLMSRR